MGAEWVLCRENRLTLLPNKYSFRISIFQRKKMDGINEYKFLFLLLKIFSLSFNGKKYKISILKTHKQSLFWLKLFWRFFSSFVMISGKRHYELTKEKKDTNTTEHERIVLPNNTQPRRFTKKSRSETATWFLQNYSPELKYLRPYDIGRNIFIIFVRVKGEVCLTVQGKLGSRSCW